MEKNTKIAPEVLEEIARAEQRKYKAEWRNKNKDKIRESNKRYWAKKAIKRLEQTKEEE